VVELRVARRAIVRQQEAVAVLRAEDVRLARLHVLASGAALDRRARAVGHDLEVRRDARAVVDDVAGVEGQAVMLEAGAEDVVGLTGVEEGGAREGGGGGSGGHFDGGCEGCGCCLNAGDRGFNVRACYVIWHDGGSAGLGLVGYGGGKPEGQGFGRWAESRVDCFRGLGCGLGA